VFSPSCISHTVITKPDWTKVRIGGVSLPDAIECWVGETQPGEQEQEQEEEEEEDEGEEELRSPPLLPSYSLTVGTPPPAVPAAAKEGLAAGLVSDQSFLAEKYAAFPGFNGAGSGQLTRASSLAPTLAPAPPPAPMMADSPELMRRHQQHRSRLNINANLVRSIGDDGGGSQHQQHHSNSMSHRIRKVRHRHNITDNRTGQQGRSEAGKYHSSPCHHNDRLEKKIRCAQEENRLHLLDNTVERTNRDLVRSLGGADTTLRNGLNRSHKQRKRRRRRKKRRQIHIDGEEALTKEERRALRRAERRRLKAAERRRRKEKREKEEMERREKKAAEEEEELRRKRERRKRRGTCRSKLVDTCSWPQCNRSCPKLHNPVTGQSCYLFFSLLPPCQRGHVFCFLSSLPLLFLATTAVFGSFLPVTSLLFTKQLPLVRACLSILWERFRGTQKEDDRGLFCVQSSLLPHLTEISAARLFLRFRASFGCCIEKIFQTVCKENNFFLLN